MGWAGLDTDHFPLVGQFRVKLKVQHKRVMGNPDVGSKCGKETYSEQADTMLSSLGGLPSWERLAEITADAQSVSFQHKERAPTRDYISDSTWQLVNEKAKYL